MFSPLPGNGILVRSEFFSIYFLTASFLFEILDMWIWFWQKISKASYCFLNSSKKLTKLTILSREDAQDSEFRSVFFGRIEDTINCFRNLLTFREVKILLKNQTKNIWSNFNHWKKELAVMTFCFCLVLYQLNLTNFFFLHLQSIHKYVIAIYMVEDCLGIVFDTEEVMKTWLEMLISCQMGGRSIEGIY